MGRGPMLSVFQAESMADTRKSPASESAAAAFEKSDEARAELAALAAASGGAVIRKSLEGVVTGWDPSAERLFGYRAWEMLGRPAVVLVPPDRQAEQASLLERVRRGERIENFHTVRKAKNGRRLSVSLTLSVAPKRGDVIEIISLVS